MIAFLTYDLKVAVLIAVFYMFYRLLLSRETFHRVNRLVLLLTALGSFVLPLCVITIHQTVVVERAPGTIDFGGLTAVMEEPSVPLWQSLVVALFFVGMAATLGYTLQSVLRVWMLISRSEQHPQPDGTILCVADGDISPFSWMHYIVLSRSDYEVQDTSILAHERGHISQHHSLDLMLVDTLTALQWFNPAMWMLRQDLRAIHEYEADAAVLSQGINMRQYQYLLIQKAVSHCGYSVANGISHSTLKSRINMMLHKNSSRASLLKLLALVPIVGTALALQAETVNDYVYSEPQKKVVKKGRKDGQIKMGAKTIEVQADSGTYTGKNVVVEMNEKEDKKPIVIGSWKSTENPLIIIDGKRVTKEELNNRITAAPQSVDHIDVLKEKSGVELYGEEGKNGVIIITTTAGKTLNLGKAKIDSTGIQFTEAQVEEAPESPAYENVFDVVEQMPEFPGGAQALMNFLTTNVHYPEAAYKTGAQGRVLVQFIVETDGTISHTNVLNQVNDDLAAEAVRLIGSMPKWKPGMQNGKVVRVKYVVPVTFRLS